MMLAIIAIEWSTIVNGIIHLIHEYGADWSKHNVHLDITHLIMGDFAAGAVLISMGGILGKATHSQMFFMTLVEIIFYAINE